MLTIYELLDILKFEITNRIVVVSYPEMICHYRKPSSGEHAHHERSSGTW